MGLPELSLIALAVAVVVGIVRNVNVGPLSMAIALVIGYYIGGVKIRDLIAGYPVNVFLMLAGITYLFAIANINGTLAKLTKFCRKRSSRQCRAAPYRLVPLGLCIVVSRTRSHYDLCFDGSAMHAVSLASENTGFFDGCDGSQWHASRQYVAHSRRRGHREGAGGENESA